MKPHEVRFSILKPMKWAMNTYSPCSRSRRTLTLKLKQNNVVVVKATIFFQETNMWIIYFTCSNHNNWFYLIYKIIYRVFLSSAIIYGQFLRLDVTKSVSSIWNKRNKNVGSYGSCFILACSSNDTPENSIHIKKSNNVCFNILF